MPKCIRCGKREHFPDGRGDWIIVEAANGGAWSLAENGTTLFWGLCPDCQLPEKVTALAGELLIEEEIRKLKEKIVKLERETINGKEDICTLKRHIEQLDKGTQGLLMRILSLERQMDRVWEMIQRLGSIIE